MPRIALYFDNHDSLGHATIILALVRALKKAFGRHRVRVMVIENGSRPCGLFPFQDDAIFYFLKRPDRHSWHRDPDAAKTIRQSYARCKEILDAFRPDLFITEYHPFFVNPLTVFLPRLLEGLKTKKTKIMSSCFFMNETKTLAGDLEDFYDLVFFHWPEIFRRRYHFSAAANEPARLDRLLLKHRKKIVYTGFVLDIPARNNGQKTAYDPGDKKRIVISRGGLMTYPQLIDQVLLVAGRRKDWNFLISAGGSKNDAAFMQYKKSSRHLKNVLLKNVIFPDFDNDLSRADLSLSLCGYNTMVRLMFYKKRCILLPVVNMEQVWNARILADFLPSRMISEKSLTSGALELMMQDMLQGRKTMHAKTETGWFEGADTSARVIKQYI
jgi:predicted glycosyltransferase